jgi:hypothetical protein
MLRVHELLAQGVEVYYVVFSFVIQEIKQN